MATLTRTRALPVLPSGPPACPSALKVHGVTPEKAGVVCRVIEHDRQLESGVGMNPAQLAQAREGGDGDTFLSIVKDPSTVERFCFGDGVPVVNDLTVGSGRDSYTYCPVKQAEVWAAEHGQEQLGREVPESVATDGFDPGAMEPEIRRGGAWDDADIDLLEG